MKTREEINEELRDIIVDLADIWDGKESLKYGMRLTKELRKLGIKDIPKWYSQDHSDLRNELSSTNANK